MNYCLWSLSWIIKLNIIQLILTLFSHGLSFKESYVSYYYFKFQMKLQPIMSRRLSDILQTHKATIEMISTFDLKTGATCKNFIYCDPQTAYCYTTSATRIHLCTVILWKLPYVTYCRLSLRHHDRFYACSALLFRH